MLLVLGRPEGIPSCLALTPAAFDCPTSACTCLPPLLPLLLCGWLPIAQLPPLLLIVA